MQPESSAISPKKQEQLPFHNIHTKSQYGLIHQNELASGILRSGARLDDSTLLFNEAPGVPATFASANEEEEGIQHRLRAVDVRPPEDRPVVNERYRYSSRECHEGLGPIVAGRGRNTAANRSYITDLPNEALTNILSNLPPKSLSDVSLVSRWFHALVTSPHAWRQAFSRLFPGAEALDGDFAADAIRSERRIFSRLTSLATWRSEYIVRPRLLLSLARGRPAESEGAISLQFNGQVTYSSHLRSTVNHLHANFEVGALKGFQRLIHGAAEFGSASLSEPSTRRVDGWSQDDRVFSKFCDQFPGDAMYGLGIGNIIGLPNVMDVSQPHGVVYAEGFPGGTVYLKSVDERRGRSLAPLLDIAPPCLGIPQLDGKETVCSVWIAKNSIIPDLSLGLIGLLTGSSHGIVSSYSLGTSDIRKRTVERGELIARWVLSPGIPIIAIAVDEQYSSKRHELRCIWGVVLNAMGEVFYLSDFPDRSIIDRATKLDEKLLEILAWETGRTVYWKLLQCTARVRKPDPYHEFDVDGFYSPRSSWNGMGLSRAEVSTETAEIETSMRRKPAYYRKLNQGWDMRRRLEVDYASSDFNVIGESIVVINCGFDEDRSTSIKRFTRCKRQVVSMDPLSKTPKLDSMVKAWESPRSASPASCSDLSSRQNQAEISSSPINAQVLETAMIEEWRTSTFGWGALKSFQIKTTAMDQSTFASATAFEDPLLMSSGSSTPPSPLESRSRKTSPVKSFSDIPGQRGRFMAAGTNTGVILLWNLREPPLMESAICGVIKPVRVIRTDSPQITCLALSALYLVHGGNDGLVQAWDPLASTLEPIRTLSARVSRARRRIIQAEAPPEGITANLAAAGAICLDRDPTTLRGMVSVGTQLRYWSYSSSAADQYKGNKRRRRRSERDNNQKSNHFTHSTKSILKDYITDEKLQLEREKRDRRKEEERLAGRFGVDLLGPGANEEDILAYAALLSKEAAAQDKAKRKAGSPSNLDGSSIETIIDAPSPASPAADEDDNNADIAEAIRRSLEENHYSPKIIDFGADSSDGCIEGDSSYPIRQVKSKRKSPSVSPPSKRGSLRQGVKMDNLELALELSMIEDYSGKGKGKEKARSPSAM